MNTNLTGPFLCTQHAFRIMKDQTPRGGRIINNGSISAHAPRPFSSAYTSTKHAITGLTKATNLDGRMYDIAVGQVDIGNAATPMTDRMVAGPGVMQPDGTMKHEPRMDAKAVGDAVAYMAGLPLDANVLFMTVMATQDAVRRAGLAAYAPQALAQEPAQRLLRRFCCNGGVKSNEPDIHQRIVVAAKREAGDHTERNTNDSVLAASCSLHFPEFLSKNRTRRTWSSPAT